VNPPTDVSQEPEKQGTDLLDIVRLVLDEVARPTALGQISAVATKCSGFAE